MEIAIYNQIDHSRNRFALELVDRLHKWSKINRYLIVKWYVISYSYPRTLEKQSDKIFLVLFCNATSYSSNGTFVPFELVSGWNAGLLIQIDKAKETTRRNQFNPKEKAVASFHINKTYSTQRYSGNYF